MFTSLLGLVLAADPHVLAQLEGDEFAQQGIIAEMVERPAGISDEQFAQRLIDAEGLRSWNGKQEVSPQTQGSMATIAVFSGDGREIIVKYVASNTRQTGKVCRFRLSRGGMTDARWNAYRWCAAAFGMSLPTKPPPLVRQ